MLVGLFQVLLLDFGKLVLFLVYGKNQRAKFSEKKGLIALLSLANIFWLLCLLLLFLGAAAKDTVICAILAIGYPVAIAIWAVIERKKQV